MPELSLRRASTPRPTGTAPIPRCCSRCASPRPPATRSTRWCCAAQIQIDAQLRELRRRTRRQRLGDLFGERERWGDTLRPFNWTHAATMLQGFRGSTEVDVAVPCTYDFDVAAAKYLHGLPDGVDPARRSCSAARSISRGATGYAVTQIPWHKDCTFPLPVATWRQLVDLYWPGQRLAPAAHATPSTRAAPSDGSGAACATGTRTARRCSIGASLVSDPTTTFDRAAPIADAVLWEGYVLYPYRGLGGQEPDAVPVGRRRCRPRSRR